MATLWRLRIRANEVSLDLFARRSEAEANRQKEHAAAIAIQSWYRGHRVRSFIRYLNRCATAVQKSYRAHIGRAIYRAKLQAHLERVRRQFYAECAIVIQTRWRGYHVRKYVFDFYARKEYLEALQDHNEYIRNQLNAVKDEEEEKKRGEKKEKERLISIGIVSTRCTIHQDIAVSNKIQSSDRKTKRALSARRKHHMISTTVIPSVYNSPYLRERPLPKELELRNVKPLAKYERESMEKDGWVRRVESGVIDMYDTQLKTQEKQTVLPPIKTSRPQGPFRDPIEVKMQRYKPLRPTLRVATSFNTVEESRTKVKSEEWTRQVIDQRFVPFTKTTDVYQPLIHKDSPYVRPAYGTKHFREENISQQISKKPFKTLVPPIPLFEQLGKTY